MIRSAACTRVLVATLGLAFLPTLAQAQVSEPTKQSQGATTPSTEASHNFGLGLRLGGSSFDVGGSARAWFSPKVGLEAQVSRIGQDYGGYGFKITQFAPVILVRVGSEDQDEDVRMRPYVGAGLNFYRSTLDLSSFGYAESDSSTGIQLIGGAEFLFRSIPKLVASADLGYYSTGTLFDEVSVGGFAFSISGHFYFK